MTEQVFNTFQEVMDKFLDKRNYGMYHSYKVQIGHREDQKSIGFFFTFENLKTKGISSKEFNMVFKEKMKFAIKDYFKEHELLPFEKTTKITVDTCNSDHQIAIIINFI